MSKTFGKSLSLGAGVLAMVACNPYPSSPGVKLTMTAPPTVTVDGAAQVELDFVATATIDGAFTLAAGACDPASFSVNTESGALVPGWDPYACSEESGEPIQGQGHIQTFIDGIFMGYHLDTDLEFNMAPKLDGTDIRMAYYVDEAGGSDFVDVDLDGNVDAYAACYFYYPQDNVGYVRELYDTFINGTYTPGNIYGANRVFNVNGDDVTGTDDEAPDGLAGADFYGLWPWTTFEHFGANVDEALVEGYSDFDPYANGQHVFYSELHYDNFSVVYGAGRQRYVTGQLDLNSMPADWCGFLAGLGNPVWFY